MIKSNRVVAFLVRDEKGLLNAVGKCSVKFTDLYNMLELWNHEDPVEYEKFRNKIMAAFDLVGRDLDKEEENHETKNSAA